MTNGESDAGQSASVDLSERSGSIAMVVALAAILIAAAVALTLVDRENAESMILGILAFLAVIGVFSVFATAVGILQFGAGPAVQGGLGQLIVDQSADGLVITDKAGGLVFANPAYLALTAAKGEADVRPVETAFTGEPEVSEAIYRLAQAARAGQKLTEEFRLAAPPSGGAAAWFRIRVRPLEGAAGKGGAVWTVSDVTRERERQENVFQDLQQAIDYLDHAPAGFFSVAATGEIVYLNATLAGWLDFDLAEVGSGGLKLTQILADESPALLLPVAGEPGAVKTDILDLDLRRRNGALRPVRLFHRIAFAADGMPGASRTLVLDREPMGDSAEGLRAAEIRFARFFNNSPLAIATVNREGRIARTNTAFVRLFGETPGADIQTQSLLDGVAERERNGLASRLAQAAERQGSAEPIEMALAGEGDRFVRFWIAPVDSADKEGEAVIVYATEITEQRALQEQFAQSQKMQAVGQLAGGVAHDFNNVLGAIMLAADFLIASHKPGDPSFQDIMSIKNNANRAADLVRQLLAFSRRQTLRPQVLNLSDAVSDLSMLLRRLLGEKITLDMVHGRDLWPVKADVTQFGQVVVNLALNARDAMPNGGKVSIRTRNVTAGEAAGLEKPDLPPLDYVVVEVEDNGSGIPAAIRDKIFEPFFTTKDVGKGTGLGLSMVYGIVKQTGGSVIVDSVEGQGTVFRIFLPRHIEAENIDESAGEAQASAETAKPKDTDLTGHGRILLVEDEEALRALSARTLVSRGFEVIEAGSGVEALQAMDAAGGQIDLVVSDVVMPEMDGPTLLKELRHRNPKTRIVFVSGYAQEAFAKNMPEGEKFAFLPKPFSMKQLVEAVKANIGG